MPGVSAPPRCIGRNAELARLGALLDDARRSRPRVAVVSGEAGIGKSTVIEQFCEYVEGRVVIGRCAPFGDEGTPFAPIRQLVRALDPTADFGAASRVELFQSSLDLVARSAADEPLVLVVEDVHWADRSTLDLIAYLIVNLGAVKCLLVLTYRTDDVRRGEPIASYLSELVRLPAVATIELTPFPAAVVAEQIEWITGGRPSTKTLRSVMARTQGNPFFVHELAASDYLGRRELPATLRQLLLARADTVSSATLRALRVLSLAEDQIPDDDVAAIAGLTVAQLRECVHEAVRARLVRLAPTGAVFVHALMREALADDLLPGERADFHAAIADALAAKFEATTDAGSAAVLLGQLAHHRQEAGDRVGALGSHAQAARAAATSFAFAEAHHHWAQVLAGWELVDDPRRIVGASRGDAIANAAEMADLGGDPASAVVLARQALDALDRDAAPVAVGLMSDRLASYLRNTTDYEDALPLSQDALALVPDHPPTPERAIVLAGAARQLMYCGRHGEARTTAREAARMAHGFGIGAVEADALNTAGVSTTIVSSMSEGLAEMDEALRLARRCGDAKQQMRSLWNTFACLFDAADWERALDAFERAAETIPRLGLAHVLPDLYGHAAEVLMHLGRWEEATAVLADARERFAAFGNVAEQVDLLIAKGDFDDARRVIDATIARAVYADREAQAWPLIHRAAIASWESACDEARNAVDTALEMLEAADSPRASAYAAVIGARRDADAAVAARRNRDEALEREALARVDRFVKLTRQSLERPGPPDGWKREVAVLLSQCEAEQHRAADVHDPGSWAAATAGWDAMAMPYHAAYTRFRQAECIVAADGDRESARSPLEVAHLTASALGAEPLRAAIESLARRARIKIAAVDIDTTPHGLTAREIDVLEVMSTGATNRQIAETLFISEKTASVHVSNILRKLGASTRGEAVAAARRQGIAG
jgi:DNA-binding CsgD family transcriptional regulator/tetratricopeptide (TPR) repeat protein